MQTVLRYFSTVLKLLKKILLPLVSAFMVYKYLELHHKLIDSAPMDLSLGESALLAFLLSAYLTGTVALIGFAYPTHKLLHKGYYTVNNPDQLKQVYKLMGVSVFRKALMIFFWGAKKNRKKYFDGTKSGIDNLIFQTKQSEFGHLIAFLLISVVSVHLLFLGYFGIVLCLSIINVIGNFYPIILQRHHRGRIQAIFQT